MRIVHLRRDDYPGDAGWRLLDWCLSRGADEVSLTFLGPPYLTRTASAAIDELLAPFRSRVASAGDRWVLNGETVAVLREFLLDGPFARTAGVSSLQDLTVYRGGEEFLHIASRDGTADLRVRDDEEPSLDRAGLAYHRRRTG